MTDNEPVAEAEEDETQQQQPNAPPTAPEPKKDEDDTLLKKAIEVVTKGKAESAKATGASGPQGLPEKVNPLTEKK